MHTAVGNRALVRGGIEQIAMSLVSIQDLSLISYEVYFC